MSLSRREFMRNSATIAFSTGYFSSTALAAKSRPPNILWIMTDQQPVSTLGCYGNSLNPTPAVDKLASEGIRFDNFHIAAFPCSPSRACSFTGLYSHTHGVTTNDVLLDPTLPTLGTICRDAGYDTAFYGKSHLSGNMYRLSGGKPIRKLPYDGDAVKQRVDSKDGFSFKWVKGGVGEDAPQMGFIDWAGGWLHYHDYLRSVGLDEFNETAGNHLVAEKGREGTHRYSQLPDEHHQAAFFRKRAVDFIAKHKKESKPFCMVVSFFGPHLPVAPPKPWDTKYSLDQIELPANLQDDLKGKPVAQRRNGSRQRLQRWKDSQFKDYIRRYYGYCAYIDLQVEKILAALDDSGQADNTIVVFTSDHGDMVCAHGMIYKLSTCGYDELLRVPFVLRYPRLGKSGHATDALVSSVDALPTLLELAGLPLPGRMDGRSFRGLLDGEKKPFREFVVCNSGGINLTVINEQWKYVCNWRGNRDLDELYDRRKDPGELHNLAYVSAHAKSLTHMRDLLANWLLDSRHPYAGHIITTMHKLPDTESDLQPTVISVKHMGSNKLELTYEWRVESITNTEVKNRSFCQFIYPKGNKRSGIAFRHTHWTETPTTKWKAGDVHKVGPVVINIPKSAPSGRYEMRIGLYDPTGKGQLKFDSDAGNYFRMGHFIIEREGDEIKSAAFEQLRK
jgi:arylsulfatase